jgi:MraZ protein
MRFLGNIEAKADSKGRVFLPAGFRKVLQASGEDQIVMRKDVFQDCLVLYPESVWNEQVDLLRSKLNRWNKQHQQIYRQFVSDVELVNLDASGRMLIPRRYQQLVGITQEVRFLGVGDTIEIWAGGKDSKPFMGAEDFGKALEELMGEEQLKPLTTQPLSRPSDTLSP